MMNKISWEEMKNQYPEEWLLITDFDLDASGHILAGVVDRHSKQKDVVYRLPSLQQPVAFRYTGESNFAGLRSHNELIQIERVKAHASAIKPGHDVRHATIRARSLSVLEGWGGLDGP